MATKNTAAADAPANPGPYLFQNVSPLGDLDLLGVGVVPALGEFTVTDYEQARSLYWQPLNWKALDTDVDWGTDPAAPPADPEPPVDPPAPVDVTPPADPTTTEGTVQ